MLNLLQLMMFMLIWQEMDSFPQTIPVFEEHHIQEEFKQLLDTSEKVFVTQGDEFILRSMRNRTKESLPPLTLSHYCLLQTIWALASGHDELAKTFVNKSVICYDSTSEEWLEYFLFDSSLMFEVVKSTSNISEGNDILKKIALFLSRKYNLLIKAAEIGDDSLIIWLKDAGLDFSPNGSKAVASAWLEDHIDTLTLLLEMGALADNSAKDLANISNCRGETLLHFAAGKGLNLLAKQLLDGGAKVDQKDVNSFTPLYHAMRANKKEMVRLLLQSGAELRTRSQNGNSLLHLAVIDNCSIAISGLLEFGLEIQTENYEEVTPLLLAAEHGYNYLMDFLINRGANANYKIKSGNALLHIAVKRGSLIAVKNLINHGALIDSKNMEDLTPLYLAASFGNPSLITFFLNKGAARHDLMTGDSLLHIAAQRGDSKAIEWLVNLCIPVDESSQKGLTPLYSAASAGQRSAMELLLAKGADLYITLSNGQRLLHVAAVEGNVVALESLLNMGINIDVRDTDILTGLCRAVENDNILSVGLLIEKGANTSFRTPNGDTLLHIAAVSNSHESIKLLIENGLNIDAENYQNETPLYLAAKNNNIQTVNFLIILGANKNYITSKGSTLAHLAAVRNDFAALKTLLDIGADFNAIDKEGFTPLYDAIRKSNVKTANIMLKTGVDIYFINSQNDSLLHIVGRNKDHNVMDYLIDRGMYIDTQGPNGSRPVDIALHHGNCDTAEYFIKKGANVRGRNGINQTVLHSAVIGDCSNFLKNIAIHIDDIDPKDQNMQTPLHWAAVHGMTTISETLISLGADVNSVDKYNSTPFQIAAINRRWDMVSSFLKKDVNLDWTDAHGRTLLHLAAIDNKEDVVRYLTKQMRVDIYIKDIYGRIPLHLAAEKGWSGIMSYLTDERVPKSLNYRDYEGNTPLHLAAIGGHKSSVNYLLDKGADPQATDSKGLTPLIYAAKYQNWEIARRLLLSKTCMNPDDSDIDEDRKTVLHLAVIDGEFDIIKSYKECFKKDINRKDSKDQTPLALAITMENRDIVSYFFEIYRPNLILGDCIALRLAKVGFWNDVRRLKVHELGPLCRDEYNRTLLHLAAWHGEQDIVNSLLQNLITKLDATDIDNRTSLHLAAINNRHVIVRMLLKHGASKDVKDRDHKTPLSFALTNKNWDSVRELLENETDVGWTDVHNRTLLHYIAINGQTKIIQYLLKNTNIDVNAKDVNLDTPIQLVAAQSNLSSHDRIDIMDRLIRNGADWKGLDKQKRNLLHLITMSGDEETLKYILSRLRLDINGQDINSQTPLHIAIINGHNNTINTLLRYKADRNVQDINHFTPLVYAIKNRFDAVDLLDEHTDTNWFDTKNRSLLHMAAMYDCSEVVRKLFSPVIKKIDIDLLDINGHTPLHTAARENHSEIVEFLLQEGANGHHLDKENRSALNLAVIRNSWKAVEALVKRGYYREYSYDRNRTLLHLAIINSVEDLIDSLINNEKVELTATDDLGDTPLHIAARKNDFYTVQKLLNKNVKKDILNRMGQNPLKVAMISDSWGAIRALIYGNCDVVQGLDENNRTLLHLAAYKGHLETMFHLFSCRNVDINALDSNHETSLDLLIKSNPWYIVNNRFDMNWRDAKGRTILHHALSISTHAVRDYVNVIIDAVDNKMQTPLHITSITGDHLAASILIRNGASINAVDINRHTPMHLASMNGHKSFIEFSLQEYGNYNDFLDDDSIEAELVDVRLNARDLLGRTPLQLSMEYGHKEIATLLSKFGATI